MKNLFIIVILISFNSCDAKDKEVINTKDLVSKKYFVKGMTCGGCIIGVKTALNKSTKLKIAGKDIEAGKVTLKFKKDHYKEATTDCDVTKAIEKATEFKVFLNKSHTKKACES